MSLTTLSTSGGCGCKLPAHLLKALLAQVHGNDGIAEPLLVSMATADDAAVWRLSADTAIIATTDFFSPIVDDPHDFGQIAATNALSDIYAMGGKPLFALALAAMPTDKISTETIAAIFSGGQASCQRAGAVIAGGHSIRSEEPFYGLAVIGQAHPDQLLTNAGAQVGDVLLLGKPLGIGILSAAHRQGQLPPQDYAHLLTTMTQLNSAGSALAQLDGTRAMTDVTGFGITGHLLEMCQASHCGADLYLCDLPILPNVAHYIRAGMTTGAAMHNRRNVEKAIRSNTALSDDQYHILTDPQTSGGLLLACTPASVVAAQAIFNQHQQQAVIIGSINDDAGQLSVHL